MCLKCSICVLHWQVWSLEFQWVKRMSMSKVSMFIRLFMFLPTQVFEIQWYFVALLWGKFRAPHPTKPTPFYTFALVSIGPFEIFEPIHLFLYSLKPLIVYSKFPLDFIYYHLIRAQHLSWCISSSMCTDYHRCVHSSCFICPHIHRHLSNGASSGNASPWFNKGEQC